MSGARVEMWFNTSSADGATDFMTVFDTNGAFESEELEGGIYFFHTHGLDHDNINLEGSVLASIDESKHEVDVEIEVE